MSDEFRQIKLASIRAGVPIDFDVYIKVTSKYLLYVRAGDDLEKERMDRLTQKKVEHMYINNADSMKYQDYISRMLDAVTMDSSIGPKERAEIVATVTSYAITNLHENGTKGYPSDGGATLNSDVELVKRAGKAIIQNVAEEEGVLKEFLKCVKESKSRAIYEHGQSVASLSSTFAYCMQLGNKSMEMIAAAGMMADIGVISIPSKKHGLFTKEYSEFTDKDWEIYKTHPQKSYDYLKEQENVSKESLDLILAHEERRSGTGFPTGRRELSLAQEIVALCACYDRLVTCLGYAPKDALYYIEVNEIGNFDHKLIKDFKATLKRQGIFTE